MPTYAYTAVMPSGSLAEATVEAASESAARSHLQGRGERVIRLKEAGDAQAAHGSRVRGKKPPQDEVAGTVRQLSILIRA